MKRLNIAVVGAGMGGLTFAALAARDGATVKVFDQYTAPRPIGSGLVVQPVGQDVLRAVGAGVAMDMGQPIKRMLGYEVDHGRTVLDVHYDLRGSGRYGLAIHRASLFQCLFDAARSAGAEIIADHCVTRRDGPQLRFQNGESAGPFDLIVDAAGSSSPLSALVSRTLPYGAIWGTVPWPSETSLPSDQLSQRYQKAKHMVGVLPIGRMPTDKIPRAAIFWSLPSHAFQTWRESPLGVWKAAAVEMWPEFAPFLDTITSHTDMTEARYSHGTLVRPVGEAIAHIGDAAHRASPQLGQGANMALLDAQALSTALRQNHHLPDALMCYAKARRWHVWTYQAMSALFTPQYQSDSAVQPILRDHLLAPLSRAPIVPRILSRLVCGDMIPPLGSLRT